MRGVRGNHMMSTQESCEGEKENFITPLVKRYYIETVTNPFYPGKSTGSLCSISTEVAINIFCVTACFQLSENPETV